MDFSCHTFLIFPSGQIRSISALIKSISFLFNKKQATSCSLFVYGYGDNYFLDSLASMVSVA